MTTERTFDPALPFLAYPLAVDLANSTGPPGGEPALSKDLLADRDGLGRWWQAERHVVGDLGTTPHAAVDLGALRSLRGAVDRLLRASLAGCPLPDDAVFAVNAASAAAPLHAELVDGDVPRVAQASHAPDVEAELHGRIARSAIDVVVGPDREGLSVCRAPSCGLLFVAGRRGQRWCSDSCGNRARVARHYHRRRHAG